MTKEESRLWYDFLRAYPVRFSRQKVLGKYIADFYSAEAKIVIELNGSQHYEDINTVKDAERTAFLELYGLTVIRIPNNEVSRNFRGVCEYIDVTVKQSISHLRWQRSQRESQDVEFRSFSWFSECSLSSPRTKKNYRVVASFPQPRGVLLEFVWIMSQLCFANFVEFALRWRRKI